jgi:3-oxoacyl-[acyl-carrier-protein] synthase-3
MTPIFIRGLATWFPDTVRTNDAWPEAFATPRVAAATTDRTFMDIPHDHDDLAGRISARHIADERLDPFIGAVERRVADDAMSSREAEAIAAARALKDAGVRGEDVDVVMSWAMIPDRISPSGANYVAHAIGAERALAWGVDAACASSLVQLKTAAGLIASGQAKVVLLTQSHLITRSFPMAHPASPGLGDGACALVVTGDDGPFRLGRIEGRTHGEHFLSVTFVRDSDPEDPPWYLPGGRSRVGAVDGEGARYLMKETVRMGVRTMRELADAAGVDPESIDTFCAVQPRAWIPGAIAECLGLGKRAAVHTYESVAHLGGCGPVVNWHAAREQGRLKPGSTLGLYAQGAGFVRMGALVHCE